MSDEYVPPEDCLRQAAESLKEAADHHEKGDEERRDRHVTDALSWLEDAKYDGEIRPLMYDDDPALELVDLPPEEGRKVRQMYKKGGYSYKDLAQNFRCSVAAIQTLVEYPPNERFEDSEPSE